VFSYDATGSGLLVLRQPGDTPQQSDLRMIRREFITVRAPLSFQLPFVSLNMS